MANIYKNYIDIKHPNPHFNPIFVQYDHACLEIELLDNGSPYDLSQVSYVEFTHVRKDKAVIIHPADIITVKGKLKIFYEYQGTEMDLIGEVKASFAIFDMDDKKVSSPSFTLYIEKDLRDEVFHPAEPNYGKLQELISDVEILKLTGGGSGGVGLQGPKGDPGRDGINGKSAYQIAVEKGFSGTETQWIASLKGDTGPKGENGRDGTDGKSAYQIAVTNGFVGTESQWLVSLKGETGATANIDAHLSEFMPHDSVLSQYSSNVDTNGFYRVVEYKRPDNTLHLKSTASNPDAAGRYQTITWQFYATNGTTIALTKTWSITYDANGVIVSKVLS